MGRVHRLRAVSYLPVAPLTYYIRVAKPLFRKVVLKPHGVKPVALTDGQPASRTPDIISRYSSGSRPTLAIPRGGKDGILPPPEFIKLSNEVANKSLNNIPITADEMKQLVATTEGSGWIKLHPESIDIPENMTLRGVKPGLTPETMNNQKNVAFDWVAKNWSGACDELAKIAKPTLVITGTDDNYYVPHGNALILAGKIPGAWLVQIKDAGHAIMTQYPAEVSKILNTFLSTTSSNN